MRPSRFYVEWDARRDPDVDPPDVRRENADDEAEAWRIAEGISRKERVAVRIIERTNEKEAWRMGSVGDRVVLDYINDPYTKLEPGTKGTVRFVDSLGTVHVAWDDGKFLGLVSADGDRWHLAE